MSRIAISVCEQKEIWNRFKNGESVTDIAQYLERSYSTCLNTIKSNGGIKPHFQQRSSKQLSIREREEISRLLALGLSIRKIAKAIGRSPSTISREINRNGTKETYRAIDADKSAYIRAKRVQECKLSTNGKLRIVVSNKLKKDWSPNQISKWLKSFYNNDMGMYVSPETIYKTLYIQARGALKKELISHLRRNHTYRQPTTASKRSETRGKIKDAISISSRPPEIEDRAVHGHWEGDLIEGAKGTFVATLVERQSRYVMLVKVNSKETIEVTNKLRQKIKTLPDSMVKTLVWKDLVKSQTFFSFIRK